MALWFAVIRAREMISNGTRITQYTTNRWATRSQMDRRGSINLDEAYAAQYEPTY